MPGEPQLRERVAALEAWRTEHTRQHDRDDRRRESSVNRWFIVIAAVIGAIVGTVVTYLLCQRLPVT